jgi:hypothetical protein
MTFCVGDGEEMCFDHVKHNIYRSKTYIQFLLKEEAPFPHRKILFQGNNL